MKILQVNKYYWPWIGGIETINKEIAEDLAVNGDLASTLCCQDATGKPNSSEKINGVDITRAKIFGKVKSMPLSFQFFRFFKELSAEADIIILHHPFPMGFLAALFYSKNKKIVVWYHSDIIRQKFLGYLLRPIIYKILSRSFKIIVLGTKVETSSNILSDYLEKCAVVPYGIDISKIESELIHNNGQVLEIKSQFKKPIILAAGRLVYYKGYNVLIDAMKNVNNAQLLIIGSGSLKDKLLAQIGNGNMHDKIKIIPPVADLLPYMAACDLFVLPSVATAEAFGLVQLEAMACGKPVINTDLQNEVPQVSIDGLTGITVKPGDVYSLAQAINLLISNPELREKYGNNGKLRVGAIYSKENFLKSFRAAILNP